MMTFVDSPGKLLAACGGDTVKLFDVSVDSGDPCVLSYTPSPGKQVNSIKWNHTNLVVASAGEDGVISLWHKGGASLAKIPASTDDASDYIEESINSISFSNKTSRYISTGGTSHTVRIWDLQKKHCIKQLRGHIGTVTGVMYNCKDEHLASISLKGDLILHSLASGARAAELKDPNGQALNVLDYSRFSRHSLITAGDDGSLHLWDTTGSSPKVSWLKQHSAPTTGVCFSPSNDKVIASVGLDKKLCIFDTGIKRLQCCLPYETPFASLAYSDDGSILAAGTNSGSIVFYDVRAKPKPFTVLRAYNSSEAVSSLCWQRSRPDKVDENSSDEIALLGSTSEESVLMPDPRPPASSFNASLASSHSRLTAASTGSRSSMMHLSALEETPVRVTPAVSLSKLQAPHSTYNFKDDMDVFSPLADVQPITPSVDNQFEDHDEFKKNSNAFDKKVAPYPSFMKLGDGNLDAHPISNWRFNWTPKQDDTRNTPQRSEVSPTFSSSESPLSLTPPEAWGGNALPDQLTQHSQQVSRLSRFQASISVPSGSIPASMPDSSSTTVHQTRDYATLSSLGSVNLPVGNSSIESASRLHSSSVYHSTSMTMPLGSKPASSLASAERPGRLSTLPRRGMSYAERIAAISSLGEGTGVATGSPKSKKTEVEAKEEIFSNLLVRQEILAGAGTMNLPAVKGLSSQWPTSLAQPSDQQENSSFSLQLVQRTLEETLGSVQMSIHEDVRNLHIELLRQFHMQEMEMSSMWNQVLERVEDLTKEVHLLRRENQLLRQLL